MSGGASSEWAVSLSTEMLLKQGRARDAFLLLLVKELVYAQTAAE